MTKSISISIVTFLLLISFCACGVPNEAQVGQSYSSNIANNTPASEAITSLPPSLSESYKQLIRSRYITDTYYTISCTELEQEEFISCDPTIISPSDRYSSIFEPSNKILPALTDILPLVTLGMSVSELCDITEKNNYLFTYTIVANASSIQSYSDLQKRNASNVTNTSLNIHSLVFPLENDLFLEAFFSPAGTGTESDPFRTVISEIWCDGELIDACDTVAEEMELGILPTFLAVELHGTEYLISEGLLSEDEAVFYAEEQAVYLASQAEQESLPDAEIPETTPEVVVE